VRARALLNYCLHTPPAVRAHPEVGSGHCGGGGRRRVPSALAFCVSFSRAWRRALARSLAAAAAIDIRDKGSFPTGVRASLGGRGREGRGGNKEEEERRPTYLLLFLPFFLGWVASPPASAAQERRRVFPLGWRAEHRRRQELRPRVYVRVSGGTFSAAEETPPVVPKGEPPEVEGEGLSSSSAVEGPNPSVFQGLGASPDVPSPWLLARPQLNISIVIMYSGLANCKSVSVSRGRFLQGPRLAFAILQLHRHRFEMSLPLKPSSALHY